MIQNIILLLVTNTLAPYLLMSPVLLTPLPVAQVLIQHPSALQSMNLSRIHTQQEFKVAFRNSLRENHPDHGGSQQVFQQIQGLRKIMNRETNYYDLYNLTDADLSSTNIKFDQTVNIKKYSYYVETGIFYFITFLYILAFTLDSDTNTSRYLMLALTVIFAAYQVYSHQYPKIPTIIDLLYSKLPLFTQFKFMKRALIIWLALIRAYYSNKKTEESVLLGQLKKERAVQQYRDMLQRLKAINEKKLQNKLRYQKSWPYKIRNWVSKGISILFFLLIIKNLIPGLNLF